MSTNSIANIDALIQQSRAKGMVYSEGDVVPQYMVLFDTVTRIFKQGNGADTFNDLPVFLDLNDIDDVDTYVNAMFAVLSVTMSGSFLVVNDAGNTFEVTPDNFSAFLTVDAANAAMGNLADDDHSHSITQIDSLGTASTYAVGSIEDTIPLIGGSGQLVSSIFNPNSILSPFDSDVISFLVLGRTATDMAELMNLESSVADEFNTLNGISVDDSFGYSYVDESIQFPQIVAKDAWDNMADATSPGIRYYHGMATVKNKVYVYGGISDGGDYLNDLWEYNLATDVWAQKANGPGARFLHSMVEVDGIIYVFGGSPLSGAYYNELHKYDPSTNEWDALGTGPTGRYASDICAIGTDIYIYGGYNGAYQNDFWKYNTLTNVWTQLTAGPHGCYGHYLKAVNGRILLGGGYDGSETLDSLHLYDFDTSEWESKSSSPIPIRGCVSTVLNDILYLYGGYNDTSTILDVVLSYDVTSDEWDDTLTEATTGSKYHSGSEIEGHLVIYGGHDGTSNIDGVKVYGIDPKKKIQSISFPAEEEPTDAHLFVRGTIGAGATLNTDVVASVTRDGNNWRPVKLTELPMVESSIKCYSGDANFEYVDQSLVKDWGDASLENLKGSITSFVVDTANTSGHFNATINTKIEAGCIIDTPEGAAIITGISGTGTESNSVTFSGTLGVQTHTVDAITALTVDSDKIKYNKTLIEINKWHYPPNPSDATYGRVRHTVTACNGKLYVYGGMDGSGSYLNTMYIYDIASKTWSQGATNSGDSQGRAEHTAVLYGTDIYYYGGRKVSAVLLNTVTVYDTVNNTWSTRTANSSETGRRLHSAALSGDKMYIYGGWRTTGINTLHIYDITEDTWSSGASLSADTNGRFYHSAFIYDGVMYIYGGANASITFNTLYEYNISGNSWSVGNNNQLDSNGRREYVGFIDGDKIYVYCGRDSTGAYLNTLHVYDISDDAWSTLTANTGDMYGRNTSAGDFYNGELYVYGGFKRTDDDVFLNTLTAYIVADDRWGYNNPYDTLGRTAASTVIIGTKLYVYGGASDGNPVNKLYIYDFTTNTWSTGADNNIDTSGRQKHVAIAYNGKMYIHGGISNTGGILQTLHVYDPDTDSWAALTSGGVSRYSHSGVLYNGKIYIYGGRYDSIYRNQLYAYDIANDTWSSLASTTTGRYGQTAVAIGSKMYVYGGYYSSPGYLNSIIAYDFVLNSWETLTPSATAARYSTSIVYDDKMYIYGGYNGSHLSTIRIYDPSEDSWGDDIDNGLERTGHAIALYNETMVAYGGYNDDILVNTVDFFDISSSILPSTHQTALLPVDYTWTDIMTIVSNQVENGSTIRYVYGYNDNTFDIILSDTTRRTIARYYLGIWQYWTAEDTYADAPLNTSTSAISEYFEVNDTANMTATEILTAEPIVSGKQLTLIGAVISEGEPELSEITITGVANMSDDAPHGTDVWWKIESNCADSVTIHGLRLQYK